MARVRRKPIDIEQHHMQTNARLILGGFVIIAVVGGLLMWVLWGPVPAAIGEAMILGAAVLFSLLWLMLRALEAWARSGN